MAVVFVHTINAQSINLDSQSSKGYYFNKRNGEWVLMHKDTLKQHITLTPEYADVTFKNKVDHIVFFDASTEEDTDCIQNIFSGIDQDGEPVKFINRFYYKDKNKPGRSADSQYIIIHWTNRDTKVILKIFDNI